MLLHMLENTRRPGKRAPEARVAEIEETLGIRPRAEIAVGDPAASPIEAAEEAAPERALIAVGNPGLDAVKRLRVGSVSTKVLRASKGPVLVVNPGPHEAGKQGKGRKIGDKPDRPPVRRRLRGHSGTRGSRTAERAG
jgi:hypothetical protein